MRFHCCRLAGDEVTRKHGIPVTTVPRTLLDVAPTLGPHRLERAIQRADVLQLWDRLSLLDMLQRHPHNRGVRAIRLALGRLDLGTAVTHSELEDRFLAFLDTARLPRPHMNQPIEVAGEIFEVDCIWRMHRLIAELDGRAFHSTAHAFERDRRRHRMLEARGWRTIQVTWLQLEHESDQLAADLRRLLGP